MKINTKFDTAMKSVGKAVVDCGDKVLPVVVAVLLKSMANKIIEDANKAKEVELVGSYDNAVKCIVSSDMYSTDQRKVIEVLKQGLSEDVYKAVMNATKGSAYSTDKRKMIELIMSKTEE